MTKTKQETVLLPIRVETGKKSYAPGEPVPLTRDFTTEDAERIVAIHGPYMGGGPVAQADAGDESKLAAAADENTRLRAVIAAYEAADEAAVKAGEEDASSEARKALDDALAAVADARKAAGL